MNKLEEFFEKRVAFFNTEIAKGEKKSQLLTVIRLVLVLLIGIVIYQYFSSEQLYFLIISISFVIVFAFLIKYHARLKKHLSLLKIQKDINEEELKRLNEDFSSFDEGKDFVNPDHDFSFDLDVFGKHSLFQFINRTGLYRGRKELALILNKPLMSKDTIEERQLALVELSAKVDFRQVFQAKGRFEVFEEKDFKSFEIWMNEERSVLKTKMMSVLFFVMPVLTVSASFLYSYDIITGWVLSLPFLLSAIIYKRFAKSVLKLKNLAGKYTKVLSTYFSLFQELEKQTFDSPKLRALQAIVGTGELAVSQKIKKLEKYLSNLDATNNFLVGLALNFYFLWDLIFLYKIEKWKAAFQNEYNSWFEVVHQFDALMSLAGMDYLNHDGCVPMVKAGGVSVKNLYHPLIKITERVSNDFGMNQDEVVIVTGSNMSGKSTFLRTFGLNHVLAQLGVKVFATEFLFTPTFVFTSMRTTDSLLDNTSSFYAELKRLKRLILNVKEDSNYLFFIDEILKGTNSIDRLKGAKSLAVQLKRMKAKGFISTHDLGLSELNKNDVGFTNYSFNSQVISDEIIFDYKITEGACKSFNASVLMKKMGIEILD